MSSFCIKTNNDKFIDYFFNNISKIISDDIFIKKRNLKYMIIFLFITKEIILIHFMKNFLIILLNL